MRRRYYGSISKGILGAALVIILLFCGDMYAYYTKVLNISGTIKTGGMNLSFDDTRQVKIGITDSVKKKYSKLSDHSIAVKYLDDGKRTAFITPMPLELNVFDGEDSYLTIEYPLAINEDSVVRSLKVVPPVFDRSSVEEIVLLPEEEGAPELTWEVFREVRTTQDQIIAVVYLRPSEGSNFALEQGQTYTYNVALPLYLQQDHPEPGSRTLTVHAYFQEELQVEVSLAITSGNSGG